MANLQEQALSSIKERILFFEGFVKNFKSVGSFCSTTRWAARQLCQPLLSAERPPARILEVGAGTGSVTLPILRATIPGDRITICELEPRFMSSLKERIQSEQNLQLEGRELSYFQGPIQELAESDDYDYIICSLPFLNFEISLIEEIFSKFQRISKHNAKITYYEYFALRTVGKTIPLPTRRKRFHQIDSYFKNLHRTRLINQTRVWRNLLPINVYTLNPHDKFDSTLPHH